MGGLPLCRNALVVGVNQSNTLGHVFASRLCHSGQIGYIGSGAARQLPWEPSNIPRQIPEMVIMRNFTLIGSEEVAENKQCGMETSIRAQLTGNETYFLHPRPPG